MDCRDLAGLEEKTPATFSPHRKALAKDFLGLSAPPPTHTHAHWAKTSQCFRLRPSFFLERLHQLHLNLHCEFFFLWFVSRKLISVHMVSVSRDYACNCPEEELVDRFSENNQGILPRLHSSLLPPDHCSLGRGTFTWKCNEQESFTLDSGQRVNQMSFVGIVISSSDPWNFFLVFCLN